MKSKKRILALVTGYEKYPNSSIATGLWLSEISHLYVHAQKNGFSVDIVSPKGGKVPIDPESLKFYAMDKETRIILNDDEFKEKLENSISLSQINHEDYDMVYLAGGHGTMFDFVENPALDSIIEKFSNSDRIVAAVCHGVCGLLGAKLFSGVPLIQGKNLTGYTWFEEKLAFRSKLVPFSLEERLIALGGKFSKSMIPLTSHVVKDGKLYTGQNPFSSKELAKRIFEDINVIR